MMMFFSADGAYGSAESRDLLIIDCSQFTDEDWQRIQESTESRRIETAWSIASSYDVVEYQPINQPKGEQ